MQSTRREVLQGMALAAGAVILVPAVSACTKKDGASVLANADPATRVPQVIPRNWDPIEFNIVRGNAGHIPASYLPDVNGPNGSWDHVGKHLPYVVTLDGGETPEGYVALMWGDQEKGHTPHPNERRGEANNYEGHWYNWIRIRKATLSEAEELQSTYSEWPGLADGDSGAFAVHGGGDIEADGGRQTIYLAALPSDVQSGDIVRIHAHCLTHGEYVDFVQI